MHISQRFLKLTEIYLCIICMSVVTFKMGQCFIFIYVIKNFFSGDTFVIMHFEMERYCYLIKSADLLMLIKKNN